MTATSVNAASTQRADARPMPTTRLARRRRASRGWLMGVGLTILVNVLVIFGLSQASAFVEKPTDPPQSVRTIHRSEPPPPLTEPPPPPEVATAPQTMMPTVALPALALSEAPMTGGLELPSLAPTDLPLSLPSSVPAFVAVVPEAPVIGGDGSLIGNQALAFDEPPVMIAALDLRRFYPRQAVVRNIEGQTVLSLTIDASGVITDVAVISSTPAEVFEDAALRMAKQFRFRPAKRGGQNVPALFTQTITWHLD